MVFTLLPSKPRPRRRIEADLHRRQQVWRPLDIAAINAMEAGIFVSAQRPLSHVTSEFVDRIGRRMKQMELAAAMV